MSWGRAAGEDHAITDFAGQRKGFRALGAEEHGHSRRGRVPQLHAIKSDIPARHRDRFTVEQRPQRAPIFAQQSQGGGGSYARLAHPVQDAVADPRQQPAGVQSPERGKLHRHEGDIAQGHRQQADADAQPVGGGERGCRARDSALGKAVLPQPQLR